MSLKHRIAIGMAGVTLAGACYFGQPRIGAPEPAFGPKPALARNLVSEYDKSTDPFEADGIIKKIAIKAKAGSQLESAKKLHAMLKVSATGGLKLVSSGSGTRDDRPPRTGAQALKLGGDCSDHAYAFVAVFQEMKISSGILIFDLGGGLMHTLPYAEIDGRKHIVDSQSEAFGTGAAEVKGKRVEFTYEQAKKAKSGVRLSRESAAPQAAGAYHAEWGNFFKGQKDLEMKALEAYSEALRRDPKDSYAEGQIDNMKGRLVTKLYKEALKAFKGKEWQKAADLFEKAISLYPKSGGTDNLVALLEGAAVCRFNSGSYEKAAEHYDALFAVTGDEKYKKQAEEARSKAK